MRRLVFVFLAIFLVLGAVRAALPIQLCMAAEEWSEMEVEVVSDLAAVWGSKGAGVECFDRVDSRSCGKNRVDKALPVVSDGGDYPHSGHHRSLHGFAAHGLSSCPFPLTMVPVSIPTALRRFVMCGSD